MITALTLKRLEHTQNVIMHCKKQGMKTVLSKNTHAVSKIILKQDCAAAVSSTIALAVKGRLVENDAKSWMSRMSMDPLSISNMAYVFLFVPGVSAILFDPNYRI